MATRRPRSRCPPPPRSPRPRADAAGKVGGRSGPARSPFFVDTLARYPAQNHREKGIRMTSTVDAVVVGSGINGLVAAAELARAGWEVGIVERNDRLGGFVAGGEITAPGYMHDTFSSWHVEFVTGAAYAELGEELHRRGLEYRNAEDFVTGSIRADGGVVLAHRDPERTAAAFAHPSDRDAYLAAIAAFGADIPYIGALLGGELRSPRALMPVLRLARKGGGVAGLERRLR